MDNNLLKNAEKNCVRIAKHMNDTMKVVEALERFGSRFMYERFEGNNFQEGVRLIRDALYAKYIRSISDCFLFVGVGGKDAEDYSKEQFKKLFGDKQNAIMHLLDQYGNYPSWYKSDEEKELRKQGMKKLKNKKGEIK